MTIRKTIRGIRDSIPGGYVLGRIGGTGSGPPSLIKFTPNAQGGVGGGGGSARKDPSLVHNNASTNFTVGNTETAHPLGTISSGTVTPDPLLGNMQTLTNNGAFTLAAPTALNDYTIIIAMTNSALAGVVTTTGFRWVTGDSLTQDNASKFLLTIYNVGGVKVLNVLATQIPVLPHRYWGIRINANQGGVASSRLNNVEMANTVFGPNIMPVGGTAYATSTEAGYAASSALLQADTFSSSGHAYYSALQVNVPIWYYDFGAGNSKKINRVTLIGTNTSGNIQYNVKDMDVVYSDDAVTWTTAWSETSIGLTSSLKVHHSFPPGAVGSYSGSPWGSHPYWRLFMTDPSDFVAIAELVYEATSGGGQVAVGGTPTADTSTLGAVANAFDNNPATYWGTSSGYTAIVTYNLAAGFSVRDFKVQSKPGSQSTQTNSLFLRFSDDGTQFTTVFNASDQPPYTAGEIRTFVDPLFI